MLRCAITKQTGSGEQIVVDVCQWNPVTGVKDHETVDEMAEFAEKNNHTAIASTNHGYMYSFVDFYKACIE